LEIDEFRDCDNGCSRDDLFELLDQAQCELEKIWSQTSSETILDVMGKEDEDNVVGLLFQGKRWTCAVRVDPKSNLKATGSEKISSYAYFDPRKSYAISIDSVDFDGITAVYKVTFKPD
jgi:hypothetical protein